VHYLMLLANAPDAWHPDETGTGSDQSDRAGSDRAGPDRRTGEVIDDGVIDDGVIDDWALYTRALHDAGVLIGGAGLYGPETGTSVRVRHGRRLLTDGPFAETKEHLIGYYVIDVPDLDAAIGWAARVPNVRTGTVEIRPVLPGSDTTSMLRGGPGAADPG
jgi:hypothetical protein